MIKLLLVLIAAVLLIGCDQNKAALKDAEAALTAHKTFLATDGSMVGNDAWLSQLSAQSLLDMKNAVNSKLADDKTFLARTESDLDPALVTAHSELIAARGNWTHVLELLEQDLQSLTLARSPSTSVAAVEAEFDSKRK